MSENLDRVFTAGVDNWREGVGMMERMLGNVSVGSVFGQPVNQGDYTIITAAEVTMAMGFGTGSGGGVEEQSPPAESEESASNEAGGGGGGGAGGSAFSRPVAAISIGPGGVRVEPIVDPTKIALAFFTMLGAFLLMLGRMRRTASEYEITK